MKKIILLLLLLSVFTACKTVKQVQTETNTHTSAEREVRLDSIYIFRQDSIFIRTNGDTVFVDKIMREYRDRTVRDTVLKTDSIYVDKRIEVEKQRSKMSVFWEVAGKILSGIVALIILIWAVKKWK